MKLRKYILIKHLCTTAACLALFVGANAHALTNLKKVQVTDGSQIDLMFDSKIKQAQINTEYFNDIIQITLTDVSVYPAKISSVAGMDLTKVFAYQYSPKVVRCRVTVKGKAEEYQGRVQVKLNGKILSLKIKDGAPITASAEQKSKTEAKTKAEQTAKNPVSDKNEKAEFSADERELLDRITKSQAAPLPLTGRTENGKSKPLTGGKPLPSPLKPMGMMLLVIAAFIGGAMLLKRFRGPNIQKHKGLSGFLGKIAGGITRKGKMIEVVANHYLGPKKSIAVVKVAGRLLVLGVTNEAINLITQLPANAKLDDAADYIVNSLAGDLCEPASDSILEPMIQRPATVVSQTQSQVATVPKASATGGSSFSDVLNVEKSRPSVRAQIKSRIEGMKHL
jgi:flagellar biogenesis protein FliO